MMDLEVRLFGRVQGVGFRATIKNSVNKIGLKGWVKNNDDGSVSILVQGKKVDLNEFLLEIVKGIGFSKVSSLSYDYKESLESYADFSIIRSGGYFEDKVKSFINLGKGLVKGSGKVPNHVAIIPDGNRRWAREKGKEASYGHYSAGSDEHMNELFNEAKKLGVRYMSLWGFSTENWKRNKKEIDAIFDLLLNKVDSFLEQAHKNKIRFRHIGRKDRLPENLMESLEKLEKETQDYDDFNVQLFLDYGGRDEIVRAINKILALKKTKVDEQTFSNFLDTHGIPDVDLIIRTSGEKRISGLMPYQGTYAELYFSEKYFPDFSAKDLREAIEMFSGRIRRFGGTAKEDLCKK
jgi:undecaprenyl diphosphate synthase